MKRVESLLHSSPLPWGNCPMCCTAHQVVLDQAYSHWWERRECARDSRGDGIPWNFRGGMSLELAALWPPIHGLKATNSTQISLGTSCTFLQCLFHHTPAIKERVQPCKQSSLQGWEATSMLTEWFHRDDKHTTLVQKRLLFTSALLPKERTQKRAIWSCLEMFKKCIKAGSVSSHTQTWATWMTISAADVKLCPAHWKGYLKKIQ